jgi:leucyl-tRNA synthetase
MKRYNPKLIEKKWQKTWRESGIYKTDISKSEKKFYIIPMFPYPSGDLHVGHWYNFAPTDTIARYRRMQGYNVLHCNGFDAFGLPAENAAIKRNIPPAEWTKQNIESMTKQIEAIGASYDWDRNLITSEPEYYKWTQWLFLKLYEKGQAYKKKGLVNWCPKDQTVLANEQTVGEDGTKNVCVRCGTPIEQKELEQWYFKITDYADRLLEDAKDLDMPQRVKIMQENWIGRSVGAEIDFAIDGHKEKIRVFTTRPDTLFGATYMVLAPEHPLVKKITTSKQKQQVERYRKETLGKTELDRKEAEKEKSGVLTGAYAVNPVNDKKIPIWIADYVLMSYGTGAIMAVPAHDERDHEFAKKFELPVVEVIEKPKDYKGCYAGEGKVINSGDYSGLPSGEMREKIVADLAKKKVASEQVNYKLRDWLISRQRYWGAPIPIVYCDDCGTLPVAEDQLPVKLPEDVEFMPTGQSPLVTREDFVKIDCPKCKKPARRETDTMDTFVDSSWYFLRYPDKKYDKGAFSLEAVNKWGPLDHYIGGIEHAILHLLYARYITKFLKDHHGLAFDEPFKKLSNQGIILGPDDDKMSKSKGNVVSPDEQVNSYGADSLRLYLMFMGPYDQGGPYSFGGIAGVRRFLDRLWNLTQEVIEAEANTEEHDSEALNSITHKTIKKVSEDLHEMRFNTAISTMMEMTNELYKLKEKLSTSSVELKKSVLTILQLIAPFAPHFAEELWAQMGEKESIHLSSWPVHDEKYLEKTEINIVVQVNGKVRANIQMPADASKESIIETAQTNEKVAPYLKENDIRKTIYVPQKLVNFVT